MHLIAHSVVSFHYGADHYGACHYGESAMAQVQLGAVRYGAFQYGTVPVWRCFGMAHSSMAQVQYGAGQVRRISVWRSSAVALRSSVLNMPCRVQLPLWNSQFDKLYPNPKRNPNLRRTVKKHKYSASCMDVHIGAYKRKRMYMYTSIYIGLRMLVSMHLSPL